MAIYKLAIFCNLFGYFGVLNVKGIEYITCKNVLLYYINIRSRLDMVIRQFEFLKKCLKGNNSKIYIY